MGKFYDALQDEETKAAVHWSARVSAEKDVAKNPALKSATLSEFSMENRREDIARNGRHAELIKMYRRAQNQAQK